MGKEVFNRTNPLWVRLWFMFLHDNLDYAAYCKARRENQPETHKKLEKQYPKISEVYGDFGSVYGIDFNQWLSKHRHLFFVMSTPEVKLVDSAKAETRSIVLEIPLSLQVSKATKQAAEIIRAQFEAASEEARTGDTPKYALAIKTPSVRTFVSTMRCYLAWRLKNVTSDGNKLDQKEQVAKVIEIAEQWPDEIWDWSTERLDRKDAMYDELRRTTNKHALNGKNISLNTLFGRFPVKTAPE
jgi:hypothetical protein